jgi:hypothetical protein
MPEVDTGSIQLIPEKAIPAFGLTVNEKSYIDTSVLAMIPVYYRDRASSHLDSTRTLVPRRWGLDQIKLPAL